MDQFYVIGNPIAHSKSPIIHQHFADQMGISLQYSQKLVEHESFEKVIKQLISTDCVGANITLPFKERAYDLCDKVSARAKLSKAVNTLSFSDQGICGDNTDGAGLVADLEYHGVPLSGASILMIGAGGAARGVLPALLAKQPKNLTIANRTKLKAEAIASECNDCRVQGASLDNTNNQFDIVINATSSSVHNELPGISASAVESASCIYDMFYSKQPTSFMRWGADQSRYDSPQIIDGLGMLIEQAAEAFYVWHNVRPETGSIRQLLRG